MTTPFNARNLREKLSTGLALDLVLVNGKVIIPVMPIGMNDNVLRIDSASIVVVLNHHVE